MCQSTFDDCQALQIEGKKKGLGGGGGETISSNIYI